jgi:hypothetical protein
VGAGGVGREQKSGNRNECKYRLNTVDIAGKEEKVMKRKKENRA